MTLQEKRKRRHSIVSTCAIHVTKRMLARANHPKEEDAEAMYEIIKEFDGKKNLKAMDLIKAMIEKHGEESCDKKLGKKAIRILLMAADALTPTSVVLNPDYQELTD